LYNRLFALRNGEFTQDKEKSVRDLYMCLFFSVGLNSMNSVVQGCQSQLLEFLSCSKTNSCSFQISLEDVMGWIKSRRRDGLDQVHLIIWVMLNSAWVVALQEQG